MIDCAAIVVSVHFPKAAGNTLLSCFKSWYGAETVVNEAQDDPADPCGRFNLDPCGFLEQTRAVALDPNTRVIHGHFHPLKYRSLQRARWVTFLRHPIDNLVSIYYFWKNLPRGHCLHGYFLDAELTLENTCRLPTLRRLMTGVYFRDVDMGMFDFIGAHERFDSDLERLAGMLGKPYEKPKRLNANPFFDYEQEREKLFDDRRMMARLEDLLRDDIVFYERYVA